MSSTSTSSEPRVDTTLYPVLFRWTHPCHSVSISGSFNRWRERLPLIEEPNDGTSKTKTFSIQLDLSVGLHTFKYLVDHNEWKYDPESAFVPDCHGNINNFINVIHTTKETMDIPQIPIKTKIKDGLGSLPKMNPDATKESLAIMKEDLKAGSAVFAILKDMAEIELPPGTPSGFVSSPYSSKMSSSSMRWYRNNHSLRNALSMSEVSTPGSRTYSFGRKRSSFDYNETIDTEYGLDISETANKSARGAGDMMTRGRIYRSKSETFLDCQICDPFSMIIANPTSSIDRMQYSFSQEALSSLEIPEGRTASHISIDKSFTKNQEQMREARFSSIMLTASMEHFGGDLVTHEHSQRQMMGGHCSYITYGGDKKKERSRTKAKLLIFLVGLPGRGKTFIGHILSRHLTWMGKRCKVYNVGEYRRKCVGAEVPLEFWDPKNTESYQKRMEIAVSCLNDALRDLETNECDCAIYDGSNVSIDRRMRMREEVTKRGNTGILFIESICNDPEIIATAIHDMKLNSEDYREFTLEEAAEDYFRRIQHYESIYEPLDECEDCSFIKVIDIGRQIFSNRINGYLQSRIMFLMANIHMKPCPIWLTRHGESIYNTQDRIGGDSPLSTNGTMYAEQLDKFINAYYPAGTPLSIWTSTMLRTGMTVQPLAKRGREIVKWKQLDEIDAGICDGLTYEEVVHTMPEEYIARKQNKLFYRYPRGESYQDVIHRLEPVITEMMRMNEPLLIVAHQAILRIIYGYLTNRMPEDCPIINIPLHTVIQITLKAYKSEEVWHRPMQ